MVRGTVTLLKASWQRQASNSHLTAFDPAVADKRGPLSSARHCVCYAGDAIADQPRHVVESGYMLPSTMRSKCDNLNVVDMP